MTASPATAILVHGSWHGPWCWEQVAALLAERGVPVVAPALPSMGNDAATLGDMHADAAVVRAAIASVDGPVVVCGHSYGGFPVTEAAAGQANVRRVVYLCALVPDAGETLFEQVGWVDDQPVGPASGLDLDEATGTHAIDPAIAREALYHDVDDELAAACLARLVRQAAITGTQAADGIAWREVPSTYVVCTEDRTISVTLQRLIAARMQQVVEWPTSHSPMLSRPSLVADLLAAACGA